MRRSHHHAAKKDVQYCTRCGVPVLAHRVCWECGYSNTQRREAVEMKSDDEE
jgi:ribosomal protein L32